MFRPSTEIPMRCMKNDASQVEFQSVVANLLRYCRHGEANRCVLAEGSDTKRLAVTCLGLGRVRQYAARLGGSFVR